MMDLLNKLKLMSLNPKSSENLIEVIDILNTLRASGSDIAVQVEGVDEKFNSVVRGLSPKHRVMVIDAAPPEIVLPELRRNKQMTLSTSLSGREISFRTRFLEPFLPDIKMGYQVEIPGFLGTTQPRGAFRVLLDEMREKVSITLRDTKNHTIDGVVKNISRSGVGMKTDTEFAGVLQEATGYLDCQIALQDSHEISCKMEIKNIRQRGNGVSETFVGGRVVEISRQDSNRLLDFIEQIQNMRLKALIA